MPAGAPRRCGWILQYRDFRPDYGDPVFGRPERGFRGVAAEDLRQCRGGGGKPRLPCRSGRPAPGSAARAANSASRRAASRCAATSSSSSSGAKPRASAISAAWASTTETSSAFCSPVEHRSAGRSFGQVDQRQVGAVRADARPRRPRRRGARSAARSARSASSTASAGWSVQRRRDRAEQVQPRGREGAGRAARRQHRVQPQRQGPPGGRGGDGVARHRILQPGQPARRRARPFGQQAVALGHGVVMRRDLARMARAPAPRPGGRGSGGGREAPSWNSRSICGVSQTAATRSASSAWVRSGCAVQAEGAARPGPPSAAVPVPMSKRARGRRRSGPQAAQGRAAPSDAPADLAHARAAQAAAGAEQADRLQQVGLAHAVLAGDHDDAARRSRSRAAA